MLSSDKNNNKDLFVFVDSLFKDGASYEGTWYLGHAHGYGKFTQVRGETYEGEWVDSTYHGKGL